MGIKRAETLGPSATKQDQDKAKNLPSNITWLNPQAGKMKRILCSDWLPERAR